VFSKVLQLEDTCRSAKLVMQPRSNAELLLAGTTRTTGAWHRNKPAHAESCWDSSEAMCMLSLVNCGTTSRCQPWMHHYQALHCTASSTCHSGQLRANSAAVSGIFMSEHLPLLQLTSHAAPTKEPNVAKQRGCSSNPVLPARDTTVRHAVFLPHLASCVKTVLRSQGFSCLNSCPCFSLLHMVWYGMSRASSARQNPSLSAHTQPGKQVHAVYSPHLPLWPAACQQCCCLRQLHAQPAHVVVVAHLPASGQEACSKGVARPTMRSVQAVFDGTPAHACHM
jgi:hypothetical protein